MSWSFSSAGTPEEVSKALDEQNAGLTDQSKTEWEEAKPALKTLVEANVGLSVSVMASGHATFANGQKTYCTVKCSIQPV